MLIAAIFIGLSPPYIAKSTIAVTAKRPLVVNCISPPLSQPLPQKIANKAARVSSTHGRRKNHTALLARRNLKHFFTLGNVAYCRAAICHIHAFIDRVWTFQRSEGFRAWVGLCRTLW